MTAGTHDIDHAAHRHGLRIEAHRFTSLVAAVSRRAPSAVPVRSHGGQLGPIRESEISRRSGARI